MNFPTQDTASAISITCLPHCTILPTIDQPQILYLLVDLAASKSKKHSAPLNLSLVLDVSESMRIRLVTTDQFRELADKGFVQEVMADGVPAWQVQNLPRALVAQLPRKLDFLVEALRVLAEQLRPDDMVSFAAFATHADALLTVTPGDEKQEFLSAVDAFSKIDLGDDTYLGRGMELGYTQLQNGRSPHHINRMILFTDGFTRDTADCWQWMEQARATGTAITTMGVGDEFNEELLIPMAEQTGGHAYFIRTPDEIPSIFQQELYAAQNIGYRNSELKIQLTPGVELRQVYRVKPLISPLDSGPNQAGSYTISLGDIEHEAPPSILVELIVPRKGNGRFRIAQLLFSSDPIGENRQTARQDMVVEYANAQGPLHAQVMNIVERVTAFNLQTRALSDATQGNIEAATRKLRAAATRLLDMGEEELAKTMQQQATALEQDARLSAQATKRLRYETRRLTQKL